MANYCTAEDLILDKAIPRPPGSDLEAYVTKASAAMDNTLRKRYPTPVSVDQTVPGFDRDLSLLASICSHLATGYFVLAVSSGREMAQIHDYGRWLIEQANGWLQDLVDGEIDFASVDPLPDQQDLPMDGAVLSSSPTPHSLTDAYYHNFEPYGFTPGRMNPGESWPLQPGALR